MTPASSCRPTTGADDRRQDDELLWTEQFYWMTGPGCAHEAGPVPLVTFGDDCFYGQIAQSVLDAASLEHHTVFSGPSSSAVRAAVEAGLGVALLSTRYLDGHLVQWAPSTALEPLPEVYQVARSAPGPREPVVEALLQAIINTTRETPITSVA